MQPLVEIPGQVGASIDLPGGEEESDIVSVRVMANPPRHEVVGLVLQDL